MITFTRRYRFSASHRLHVNSLSEHENSALFGKCNNPFGHGHDYLLSVTVAGKINPETGLLISAARLDELVVGKVLPGFAHRNLNVDHPRFTDLVPTTENVALVIADLLEAEWPESFGAETDARLSRIHVQETDRNGFEVRLRDRLERSALHSHLESVGVHA